MTFTLGNKQYPVEITFQEAYGPLKKECDFNIFNMFAEDDLLPRKLLLDEEFVLELMWYFVKKEGTLQTKESMISKIPSMEFVDEFREALWEGVVNFSSPLKRPMLIDAWKVMKKELRATRIGNNNVGQSPSTSDLEE